MTEKENNRESEILDFLRSVDARAPQELHRRVQALAEESASYRRRSPLALPARPGLRLRLAGAAGLLASVALVLALALGGGSTSTSLREASALTLRPATMGAPAESPRQRAELTAAVDGIAFPYWEESFGWRASGARADRLGGRAVRTVFYADQRGQRIGYAIFSGAPAPLSGGVVRRVGGTSYRLLSENGSHVVAWLRAGHLCVVSGRGVDTDTLLRLASWDVRGSAA